eukprot:4999390-Amphidinium_carterae.1
MEKRKKKKEISARTRHQHKSLEQVLEEAPWRRSDDKYQIVEVSDATDDSMPLSALKNVDMKKTEAQDVNKTSKSSTQETSPKKKKNPEKVTHFMEMEYHGSWWTGIEHDDFRTKTYDIHQHLFMDDLDSETEVGTQREEGGPPERKIGVLHGDLARMGPGLNKFLWVLVLAAVMEVDDILTVIPFHNPLESKAPERVLTCVREVILWIRNSQYCSSITAGRFIQRFMSDNGGEFTSKPFIQGLHQLSVTLTTAPSYQPQSNGMAERCVGLMKTAVRRLLVAANLGDRFWPYAVHFAAQLQQTKALGYPWDQPVFGELVATWRLKA